MSRLLAWDLPVRLIHWLLAISFGGALIVATTSDDGSRIFPLHAIFGLMAVFLVVLRIVWGLIGSRPARFSAFDLRPSSLGRYARSVVNGQTESSRGHNPATAWFAIALFAVLLATGASGLANARGIEAAEEVHEVLPWIAAALVAMHLAGLALHTIRHRENVAVGMISGRANVHPDSAIRSAHAAAAIGLVLLVTIAGAALFTAWNPAARSIDLPFGAPLQIGENESAETGHGGDEQQEERDDHD